jgi:hypothetical protein
VDLTYRRPSVTCWGFTLFIIIDIFLLCPDMIGRVESEDDEDGEYEEEDGPSRKRAKRNQYVAFLFLPKCMSHEPKATMIHSSSSRRIKRKSRRAAVI